MKRKRQSYRLPPPARSKVASPSRVNETAASLPDIEKLGKSMGAITLALYVVGLLAVNGYLFSLGATDFTLVRVRFVYTGALVWLCASIPCIIVTTVVTLHRKGFLTSTQENPPWYTYVLPALLAIGFSFSLFVILFALLFADLHSTAWQSRASLREAYQPAALVTGMGLTVGAILYPLVALVYRSYGATWLSRSVRAAYIAYLVFALFLAAAVYVFAYMRLIYPMVPDQFGGGRPEVVRLLVKEEGRDGAAQIGLKFLGGRQVSEPVRLLYDGSENYVLRVSKDSIVQIDKELVVGVRRD